MSEAQEANFMKKAKKAFYVEPGYSSPYTYQLHKLLKIVISNFRVLRIKRKEAGYIEAEKIRCVYGKTKLIEKIEEILKTEVTLAEKMKKIYCLVIEEIDVVHEWDSLDDYDIEFRIREIGI